MVDLCVDNWVLFMLKLNVNFEKKKWGLWFGIRYL